MVLGHQDLWRLNMTTARWLLLRVAAQISAEPSCMDKRAAAAAAAAAANIAQVIRHFL
jgi:hypothetical protein